MSEIEDIIKPFWFNKTVTEDHIKKCLDFLDFYYFENKDISNIKKDFVEYQSKNNFNGILKFGTLIVVYKLARNNNHFPKPNISLENKLKVQNVRENSGVMVFSVFTSAYPSYTKINSDGSIEIVKEYDENIKSNKGEFTCKYDCSFCPKDPDMPKSYIATEPGVARAIQNDFDPVKQIFDRAKQYLSQGHPIDKTEIIIQGGTISSYSDEYITEFVRDIYWAFNVFMDYIFYDKKNNNDKNMLSFENKKLRKKLSLKEEIKINETASCRVIGLTPETRPDQINYSTIQFFRNLGATRIQLGIQHLDDDILKYNNRGCYTKHTIQAIKMLKDNGFKVDAHLMLDMPSNYTYEEMIKIDKDMLEEFNNNQKFKIDQLKIYPCMVTEHTLIKKWYDDGKYKPYGETKNLPKDVWRKMSKEEKLNHRLQNPLYKNILMFYKDIHPSIRVNRIIRDIPTNEIIGGTTQLGMRSEIDNDFKLLGYKSKDIRYREVGSYKFRDLDNLKEPIMKEIMFESSDEIEYFLSFESDDENSILYSFLRLRLSKNSGKVLNDKIVFPELLGSALIRELHTYGKVQPCNKNKHYYDKTSMITENEENKTQHKGYGKKLLKKAEEIALSHKYKKIAVTSGVGVREYYRKNGYTLDSEKGCFQIKNLTNFDDLNKKIINSYFFIFISILSLIITIIIIFFIT